MTAMWLTPSQAGERIGVSPKMISNYRKGLNLPAGFKPLKAATIPPGRVVVIKDEWVDQFVEQFAVQGDSLDDIADEVLGKLKKRRGGK